MYLLPDPALVQAQGTHNVAAFLNLENSVLYHLVEAPHPYY